MLEPGAKVPDVAAHDDADQPVRLASLHGKTVVLYFYPKANTPGCTNETIQFSELFPEFRKKGAVVVGVSRDSVKAQAGFKAKYSVPFALLADTSSAICDAFGVIVEKKNYGRTYMGIQRSTFVIGADGKIKQVWPKVTVAGHAREVLQSL